MNKLKYTYLVFISTHWGYVEGGINSFNFDLCISLGQAVKGKNYKIICLTLSDPPNSLVAIAQKNNVEIISVKMQPNTLVYDILASCKRVLSNLYHNAEFTYIIGHDIFTGEIANFIASEAETRAKSIVFHHMDYEAYYAIKGDMSPMQIGQKLEHQKEILSGASAVIAIGPKLEQSARSKTRKDVFSIIPGIPLIETWPHSDKMICISFGRYDKRTDRLKQMGLAAKAFALFVEENGVVAGRDATLKIFGIDSAADAKDLQELYSMGTKKYINILPLPYKTDRTSLLNELAQATACMVLSIHEGFGLIGLESIAAGVPLILSENSGIYDFLVKILNVQDFRSVGIYPIDLRGSASGTLNEIDVRNTVNALLDVRKNQIQYRSSIINLRNTLRQKFTWHQCALSLIFLLEKIPKPGLSDRKRDILTETKLLAKKVRKTPLFVEAVDTTDKHADTWRWNQRMFKFRHPESYEQFDLVGLSLGRSWWERYPEQDWILKDWHHEQIGQYCLCPIEEKTYHMLMESEIIETQIKPEHIINSSNLDNHSYWYLANFMKAKLLPGINKNISDVASAIMIQHMMRRALNNNNFSTFYNGHISIVAFVEAPSIRKTVEAMRFKKAHPNTKDTNLAKIFYSSWNRINLMVLLKMYEDTIKKNNVLLQQYKKLSKSIFRQPPNY